MIHLKHKITNEILHTVNSDSLVGANLSGAYLSGANLSGANLIGANLIGADLSGADLSKAYLCRANLSRADLSEVNLSRADLSGANLSEANLSEVNLSRADLSGANLSEANLGGANLSGADLSKAYLRGADLSNTCLDPCNPIPLVSDDVLTAAGFEIRDGWVYGWRTKFSQHCGSVEYTPGEHIAPWFSTDTTPCHPGIYLAGKKWLEEHYEDAKLVQCRCRRDEIHQAGDKFRTRRLEVL